MVSIPHTSLHFNSLTNSKVSLPFSTFLGLLMYLIFQNVPIELQIRQKIIILFTMMLLESYGCLFWVWNLVGDCENNFVIVGILGIMFLYTKEICVMHLGWVYKLGIWKSSSFHGKDKMVLLRSCLEYVYVALLFLFFFSFFFFGIFKISEVWFFSFCVLICTSHAHVFFSIK